MPKSKLFMRCSETDFVSSCPRENQMVELKEDGTRVMTFFSKSGIKMLSEREIDCSVKYPEVVEELKLKHNTKECILDGEICVFIDGKSEFQRILNRNTENKFKINLLRKTIPVTYIIFDILSINGESVRHYPLNQRKKYLNNIVEETEHIKLAVDRTSDFKELVKDIKERNLEGYIIKNKNSFYVGKRSHNWIKAKFKKEIILKMTDYEIHKDNNGVTYHDQENFNRVSVNGQGSKKGIDDIKKHGYCLVETQYLRKNPSNKLFQPAWKRFGEIK